MWTRPVRITIVRFFLKICIVGFQNSSVTASSPSHSDFPWSASEVIHCRWTIFNLFTFYGTSRCSVFLIVFSMTFSLEFSGLWFSCEPHGHRSNGAWGKFVKRDPRRIFWNFEVDIIGFNRWRRCSIVALAVLRWCTSPSGFWWQASLCWPCLLSTTSTMPSANQKMSTRVSLWW